MLPGETVYSGAPHPGTELEILQSAAGYYLGFRDQEGFPYSRESDYFPTEAAAQSALAGVQFVEALELDPAELSYMRNAEYKGR